MEIDGRKECLSADHIKLTGPLHQKIHLKKFIFLSLSLSRPPFLNFMAAGFFFCCCWLRYPVLTTLHRKKRNPSKKKKKKKKGTDNLRLPSTRRFYDATAEFCLHDSTEASCSSATPVPPVFPSSLFFFSVPFHFI